MATNIQQSPNLRMQVESNKKLIWKRAIYYKELSGDTNAYNTARTKLTIRGNNSSVKIDHSIGLLRRSREMGCFSSLNQFNIQYRFHIMTRKWADKAVLYCKLGQKQWAIFGAGKPIGRRHTSFLLVLRSYYDLISPKSCSYDALISPKSSPYLAQFVSVSLPNHARIWPLFLRERQCQRGASDCHAPSSLPSLIQYAPCCATGSIATSGINDTDGRNL